MTTAELVELAKRIAARPELWSSHVRHDPDGRTYSEILRATEVSAWVICWMDGHDTGFHDHDDSSGAVAVVAGSVVEERLVPDAPPARRRVIAGETFAFTAEDIHRVSHGGDGPTVTVHVYSPPLRRMDAYEVDDRGRASRQSLAWAA